MVRTPAANGPAARGSTHVPAVHSTTSEQCVCVVHAVSSQEARLTHRSAVVMRHETGRDVERALTRPHATLPAEESIGQMRALIDSLSPDQSGGFFERDGRVIPW